MSEVRISLDEKRRPQDHRSVNLAETWEFVFWTRELRCSEEELRHAVAAERAAGRICEIGHIRLTAVM